MEPQAVGLKTTEELVASMSLPTEALAQSVRAPSPAKTTEELLSSFSAPKPAPPIGPEAPTMREKTWPRGLEKTQPSTIGGSLIGDLFSGMGRSIDEAIIKPFVQPVLTLAKGFIAFPFGISRQISGRITGETTEQAKEAAEKWQETITNLGIPAGNEGIGPVINLPFGAIGDIIDQSSEHIAWMTGLPVEDVKTGLGFLMLVSPIAKGLVKNVETGTFIPRELTRRELIYAAKEAVKNIKSVPNVPENVIANIEKISELPIPEEPLIPKGTAGTVGGFETRGVPTEFQPQPKVEMAFPKSAAEILKEKKAQKAAEVQFQYEELNPPVPLTEEPLAQINIHKDGRVEVIPKKKPEAPLTVEKPPEVVKPEPVVPVTKEPWEMTREEWLTSQTPIPGAKRQAYSAGVQHSNAVKQALSEGKSVPPEVLADYPDLVAKPTPVITPEIKAEVLPEDITTRIKKRYEETFAPTETKPIDLQPEIDRALATGKELTEQQKQFLRNAGRFEEVPATPEPQPLPEIPIEPTTLAKKKMNLVRVFVTNPLGEMEDMKYIPTDRIEAIRKYARSLGVEDRLTIRKPVDREWQEVLSPKEHEKYMTGMIKEVAKTPAEEWAKWKKEAEPYVKLKEYYGGYPLVSEIQRTIKMIQENRRLKKAGIPEGVPEATAKEVGAELPEKVGATPAEDPIVQKVLAAIKGIKPKMREQAALRPEESSRRLGAFMATAKKVRGEKGFYEGMAQLKGKYPGPELEALRKNLSQDDFDYIVNMIVDSPNIEGYEHVKAGSGFLKIFEGKMPEPSEIGPLEKALGPEIVKVLEEERSLFRKAADLGLDIANIPRAIMTSLDFSFTLRQGLVAATRHPLIFWRAFPDQIKFFRDNRILKESMAEIKRRPTYDLMNKAELDLPAIVGKNEEPYQSKLADKLPLVNASNRAFSGFASRLRADLFDYLIKRAEEQGKDPYKDLKVAKDIAKVINNSTGRAGLGKFEAAGKALNAVAFSPRLALSRFNIIMNPAYYIKLDPFARREALTSLFSLTGTVLTVAGLAKLAGFKVETDLRSADFAKLKFGNTRIDMAGGFQQYIRLAAQVVSGKVISSTTGRTITLGEGYRPLTRPDIIGRFLETKTAPIASFALGLLRGENTMGEEFKLSKEVAQRFIPMVIQDTLDVAKDNPSLIPLSALAVIGVGMQTYGLNNPKDATGKELDRLKLSMDYLSRVGSKDKIPADEYQKLSDETRQDILSQFGQLISSPSWKTMTDEEKIETLESIARDFTRSALEMAKASPNFRSKK